MRTPLLCLLTIVPFCAAFPAGTPDRSWIHGSADCSNNRDPPIEVFRFDADTYVLRENKCVHFEAPFIYVLFGEHTVFVQDTGATAEAAKFPIYDTVRKLVAQHVRLAGAPELKLLITHSHSHGDHTAGDAQFLGKPGVTLIAPDAKPVRDYFKFVDWPLGSTTLDLGARQLTVLSTPGHQAESVAVYDAKTGWLLTGDSVYPGLLYIRDWRAYRASIARLVQFAQSHEISAVMGTHIEMTRTPGKVYERGTTYQPDEAPLALTKSDLFVLNDALQKAGAEPQEMVLPKFVVSPMGKVQLLLIGFLEWLGF